MLKLFAALHPCPPRNTHMFSINSVFMTLTFIIRCGINREMVWLLLVVLGKSRVFRVWSDGTHIIQEPARNANLQASP